MLDYLSDLFTITPRESFTRDSILVVLNAVKHDPELFDPLVIATQEEATQEVLVAEEKIN